MVGRQISERSGQYRESDAHTMGNLLSRIEAKRVNPMTTQEQYAPPEDILSDILTAVCHAVARAIELIPADRPESRMMACVYALKEIVDTVQQSIISERGVTTAPHLSRRPARRGVLGVGHARSLRAGAYGCAIMGP
jgi:hypothetical protein